MTLMQSIILGVIQGLTEFLPISSSAHLVLAPHLLGWKIPSEEAFVFNVLVQVATLVAVFAYYWEDVRGILKAMLEAFWQKKPFGDFQARLGWYILIGTLPAALIGPSIKNTVEAAFNDPTTTAFFLLATSILLFLGERAGKKNKTIDQMNWIDALWVGFFQAAAIFPGISRSGSTISGGMLRGLERPAGASFAFLLSMPIMLGAGLLALLDLLSLQNLSSLLPIFIPGFIVAAITGYLSIRWLIGYLIRHSLLIFSIYCAALAVLSLIYGFFSR